MCGGIQYQDHKIYFPRPNARLPVKLKHCGITWIIWGRRKEEAIGKIPMAAGHVWIPSSQQIETVEPQTCIDSCRKLYEKRSE